MIYMFLFVLINDIEGLSMYLVQWGNRNANYHITPNTLGTIRILNENCSVYLYTRKIVNLNSFIFYSSIFA